MYDAIGYDAIGYDAIGYDAIGYDEPHGMSKKDNETNQTNQIFNYSISQFHILILKYLKKWLVGLDRLSNKKVIYEISQSEMNRKSFKDLLIKYIRNTR